MKCADCGRVPEKSNEVVFERGYFWHKFCYVPNGFPSGGKLIPETILRPFPQNDGEMKKNVACLRKD